MTIAATGIWNWDGRHEANIEKREEKWVRNAYHDFCNWRILANVRCSQAAFTRAGTGMTMKNTGPTFSCKAYNGRCLTSWLADVAKRAAGQDLPDDQKKLMEKVATCVYLLSDMYCLMERASRYLYNNEGSTMNIVMEKFVKVFDSLGKDFAMQGIIRFCFLQKHHSCLHVGQLAEEEMYNPRLYHCYADEDHMGALKSKPLRLLVLSLVYYRFLLCVAPVSANRNKYDLC